jgi:hypothetical protein
MAVKRYKLNNVQWAKIAQLRPLRQSLLPVKATYV